MTYAEILIKKGKRGAAAFVQAECMSAKTAAGTSSQSPEALQTPAHLQVFSYSNIFETVSFPLRHTVSPERGGVGGSRNLPWPRFYPTRPRLCLPRTKYKHLSLMSESDRN